MMPDLLVSKDASIIEPGNPGFGNSFDETPFEFFHSLNETHPLFQLSRLRKLIENPATRENVYFDAGKVAIGQRWKDIPSSGLTVDDAFDQIGNTGAWIVFRKAQKDPEYDDLMNACLAEVKQFSGREIDQDMKSREAIIFVTSPGRVTTYHLDRECNFLMQISGQKQISVFDRGDREVTSEQELETFWSKDNNAAVYKPQYQSHAHVFDMAPGTGVHIPVNSPHWLKNGNNISVTLSVSYQYRDARRKYVYQANYYLRKAGLDPTPPGKSPALDSMKAVMIGAGVRTKKLVQRLRARRPIS